MIAGIDELPFTTAGLACPWNQWPPLPGRPSAVCVLFLQSSTREPPELVLIRRAIHLSSHKGQMGLAGGRRDKEDLSPAHTALRELEEELGLKSEHVRVLGQLPMEETLDGSPIVPILVASERPISSLIPNSAEVAAIVTAPWYEFTRKKAERFSFLVYGLRRQSYLFNIDGEKVWGLTAKILHQADIQKR